MGSKIAAKALMAEAGVPVLPGVTVDQSVDLAAAAEGIGWPVLVKAAFGGGGRGMRVARSTPELDEAVASADAGGGLGLRRRHRVPRALRRIAPPHRGPDLRRQPRQRDPPLRARVLHPAPPPEDHRGVPVARPRRCRAGPAGGGRGHRGQGDRLRRGRHRRVRRRRRTAISSSSRSTPACRSSTPSPRSSPASTWSACSCTVAEGEPLPVEAIDAAVRGHAIEARLYAEDVGTGSSRPAAPSTASSSRPAPACGSTPATPTARWCARSTTPCWPRSSPGRRPGGGGRPPRRHLGRRSHPRRDDQPRPARRHPPRPRVPGRRTDTGFLERHDPVALSAVRFGAAGRGPDVARHGGRPHRPGRPPGPAPGADRHRPRAGATWPPRPSGSPIDDGDQRVEVAYRTRRAGSRSVSTSEPVEGFELHRVQPPRRSTPPSAACAGASRSSGSGATSYVDSDLGSSVLVEVERFPLPQSAAAAGRCSRRCPAAWSGVEAVGRCRRGRRRHPRRARSHEDGALDPRPLRRHGRPGRRRGRPAGRHRRGPRRGRGGAGP